MKNTEHLSCGNKKDGELVSTNKSKSKTTDKTKIPIGNETIPTFPTKSGVTKAEATQYCTEKIRQSKLYILCKNSTVDGTLDVDHFIQQCIADIEILDDKIVALKSAMDGIRSQCEEILERVNGSKTDEIENVCPSGERGECNSNGDCDKGVCKCHDGFGGDDCSISTSQPPVIGGSISYCDVREGNCYNDFLVKSINLIDKLYCRTQIQKPFVKYLDFTAPRDPLENGVLCPYPAEHRVTLDNYSSKKTRIPFNRYNFDVSYDKIKISQEFDTVFIYDSKCISCADGACILKSGTCNVNGYCFTKGEADPENPKCKICDPVISTTSFVHAQTLSQADATHCIGQLNPDLPVLTTEIVNGCLRYVCKVNRKGFQYEVTWLQTEEDGSFQEVQTKKLEGDVAYLETSASISLFSKKTQCKVRAWYNDKPNVKSAYTKSDVIFNGISVQPSTASIKEGANQKVTLRVLLTTPLVCKSNCSNCSIHVRFVSANNLYFQPCLVILTNETREYNVTVTTSTNLVDTGETNIIVRPIITAVCANKDWENHTMPFITIKRISVTGGRCSSTGDPHIRTFDGQYFDHYKVGYYTLVESTSRLFQVQVGTFKCGSVSCNCGVAVKEDDNILVLDTCRSDLLVESYYLSHKEPDENTFIEKKSNTDYRMRFSSGAFVNFNLYQWGNSYYANIEVQVPPSDFESTKGLCGLMDKNKDNDMRDVNGKSYAHCSGTRACEPFTESWKLEAEDSLFYYQSNKPLSCRPKTQKAQNSSQSCPVTPSVISTVSSKYRKIVSADHVSCGNKKDNEIVSKKKNSTKTTDKTKVPIGNETIPTFPTKSGVTKAEATQFCRKTIMESRLYVVCKSSTVNGTLNVEQFIQQCVTDIQILDDKKVALQSAIYGIRSQCEEMLGRFNGSKTSEIENVCPYGERGECELNGKCKNGACRCNIGFGGDDCSIDSNQPPVIGGSVYYCDVRKEDCYKDFFVKSINLINRVFCRSKIEKSVEEPFKSFRDPLEDGVFCPYPAEHRVTLDNYSSKKTRIPFNRYNFDVSYDNAKFSKKIDSVFIYDSKCISCADGACVLKSGTCNINGYCFTKDEADPGDPNCKLCDPARSTSTFVYRETLTQGDAIRCKERYTIECHELHVTAYWEKDMFRAHSIKMHLNDPVCQTYESNSTHFWIAAKFDECGSEHNFTDNVIIQQNVAYITVTRRFQNLVERYASYAYKMQCEFDRKLNTSIANYYNSSKVFIGGNFNATGKTDFQASLTMYTSSSFLIKKVNPVFVTSYQPMYFGIKEDNNNTNYKFIVDKCYAKPSSGSQDFPFLFFHMKCPIDPTFKIVSLSDNHFNFQIDAFTFIRLQKSIFIVCELFVCPVSATSPECTQECTMRKRRAVSGQGPVEKIEVTTDLISFEVTTTCKEKTCPENAKCLDLYPAECRCDDGYLLDIKENTCSQKEQLLYVNEVHLDVPFIDTYSDETSTDFIEMATKVEKELLTLLQKNSDDKIIGVKVTKASQGSVILDLLLMYADNVTTNEAETAFRSALFNNTDERAGSFLSKLKKNIKPSVTVMGETKVFVEDDNTPLILGILIPMVAVFALVYGILHYVRRRRVFTKHLENERGIDNTAIEREVVIEEVAMS